MGNSNSWAGPDKKGWWTRCGPRTRVCPCLIYTALLVARQADVGASVEGCFYQKTFLKRRMCTTKHADPELGHRHVLYFLQLLLLIFLLIIMLLLPVLLPMIVLVLLMLLLTWASRQAWSFLFALQRATLSLVFSRRSRSFGDKETQIIWKSAQKPTWCPE